MLKNKISYFQGTEEPKPKKQQYEPDNSIVVQPRFVEPFYKNYDLYDVPGKHGPGAGWHQMSKHKSIKDFLNEKRKKTKNKYKAKDKYTRRKKIKARINLLNKLIKIGIDFSIDDNIKSTPILGDDGAYIDSIPIGGQYEYFPLNDFEGKRPEQLNFGRDYVEDEEGESYLSEIDDIVNSKEPDLLFPNGFDPEEDLDADKTLNNPNTQYGITDSGNTIYNKMWFV